MEFRAMRTLNECRRSLMSTGWNPVLGGLLRRILKRHSWEGKCKSRRVEAWKLREVCFSWRRYGQLSSAYQVVILSKRKTGKEFYHHFHSGCRSPAVQTIFMQRSLYFELWTSIFCQKHKPMYKTKQTKKPLNAYSQLLPFITDPFHSTFC